MTSLRKYQALGRLKAGAMNKTEAEYDRLLARRLAAGEILWYRFEGVKLRLADKTFYTADFFVMNAANELEVHEVKGFWTDDARVKTKVAADQYPFRFLGITKGKRGAGWEAEEF
ncbi:DUF1064 domain-containing protein [Pseudomonas resinovorans]|uniref:DUF1064 domain-containing protein n=1 Tax=Metapseudomonas resinovorans TaxID=53412 RepID=A0ABT4Y8Q1_METRE|nr:DUF1064 domain-containing protein [Pseudomonas resinovorans]MDA8485141.1 DUF1064 domain-containing protein [Pseudomonas resinovorans]